MMPPMKEGSDSDQKQTMRLLISARDVNAARNFERVITACAGMNSLELCVVANGHAHSILKEAFEDTCYFDAVPVANPSDDGVDALTAEAERFVRRFEPDAVLVGLSSWNAGPDEAFVVVAKELGIPTYMFQDYWGSLNKSLGVVADTVFVVDELAASLTREQGPNKTVITGAPKYDAYSELNIDALRMRGRTYLGEGEDCIVGLFGGGLGDLPGRHETIEKFSDALSEALPDAKCIYFPHPSASQEERTQMLEVLSSAGPEFLEVTELPIEASLAACDVIVCLYSSCGYDHLMLNAASPSPLGAVVYLMFDERIRKAYQRNSQLQFLPSAKRGYAIEINTAERLASGLRKAASHQYHQQVWAELSIERPTQSAGENVVQAIVKDLNSTEHKRLKLTA